MVHSPAHFIWYELITTDVRAAQSFYTAVMEWGTWNASMPGRPYKLFMAGNAAAGGLMGLSSEARAAQTAPSWIGYVSVDDVDATAQRVRSLGGNVDVPPTNVGDISRFSVFSDPQSARLALFKWLRPGQQAPADPSATGRVGWHELLTSDPAQALAFYRDLFGWQSADADADASDPYQLFSAGDDMIGGMFDKPETMPTPSWLFYFNVRDIDAALLRVKAGGGAILDGPLAVPGGSFVARCNDPQGALFALEGLRRSPQNQVRRSARAPSGT